MGEGGSYLHSCRSLHLLQALWTKMGPWVSGPVDHTPERRMWNSLPLGSGFRVQGFEWFLSTWKATCVIEESTLSPSLSPKPNPFAQLTPLYPGQDAPSYGAAAPPVPVRSPKP